MQLLIRISALLTLIGVVVGIAVNGTNQLQYLRRNHNAAKWMINASQEEVPLVRLIKDVFHRDRYDVRVRPKVAHNETMKIHISMSLYQIIEVDEPSQTIKLNVWMIQKWQDEMLYWDPREYNMINKTIIPHSSLWIPDTYLYNSVKMARDETERYMNIQAESLYWEGKNASNLSFLFPAIYTLTCRLNIRYFPYDQQNCTLTISSWTNSKSALDYYADAEVNLGSFIPNEEWDVISFRIFRHEYKYACCAEPWVILQASLVIRRKPLYYIVNLIIPTSIITIVSITGFFTPASTDDDRKEKINLGITTLLAMSILMLMVSDAMPTTSEFVPLIAWFYLSIIIIVSIGTFLTSIVLSIQGRKQHGKLPPLLVRYWFFGWIQTMFWLNVPPPLAKLWEDLNDHPRDSWRRRGQKKMTDKKVGTNGQAFKRESHMPVQTRMSENSLQVPNQGDKQPAIQMIGSKSVSRRSSVFPSKEMESMRRNRQCALEWEFLATVLDRILLVLFILAVVVVTSGVFVVGHMAQMYYDEHGSL